MKNVKFQPWVGNQYFEGIDGKRIMVLGESHYCASAEDAVPSITNEIIKDLYNVESEHEPYKNTYTKFTNALAGRSLALNEREKVWNTVLFYNYVQSPISGARIPPTEQQFAMSEAAFFEVLEKYQPDYIIVWGERLYNHLPRRDGYQLPDLEIPNGDSFETWAYKVSNNYTVQVLPIIHPSAAFIPTYWHEVIQTFIKREIA